MGKRAREKKLAKLAEVSMEKASIETRKHERLRPQFRYAKQIALALAVTVFLLWVGVVVIDRINMLGAKG